MQKNCENCLNCIFKGHEVSFGDVFEIHKCIKGLSIEKYKRRTDCNKYVSKNDLSLHYIFYHLYRNLGLIITINILILLLSQMPLFASVIVIILLIFGFWIKSK